MNTLYVLLPSLARFETVPGMRQWLVRGDAMEAGDTDELAAASCFHGMDAAVPAAALIREHLRGDAGGGLWLCADPAYVKPDMTGARVLACGSLDLAADEAAALADGLRPLFGEQDMRLETTLPQRWHLRLPAGTALPRWHNPGQILGDDLARHLPEGDAGRRWRRLFNEAQILLHQHPVNRRREQQGKMPANSLWLWGGGTLPRRIASDVQRVYADDLLPVSLARRAGVDVQPVDAFDANQVLPSSTLLDLGRSGSPQECMDMLRDMLHKRRTDALVLHFADGERWRIRRGQRWRFWRRAP